MEKQYVIKCASCKHIKPLEEYDTKWRNSKVNDERILTKNKTCPECLWNVKDSHARFIDRHGMTSYRFNLLKKD